ncbi:isoquinoline 1-oxidoreductase beta subunit [Lutibacter sp. Hel_I_33_5]|uniref:xanthine dehydrogenase family protein molybdopterin-binding subunit n=1 Tax=Lutibacter sp. Hel_I_33_5 TaxID=1566289 RepID=UPI0011AA186E|nr:molybdopterin cofactor-binding domain-containing protein [Lutibacter sp. Hel_I_33_5]TVZ57086.1 isoquinoline 1-oxidoreductase beta subunit [Lutibacter sp. Hel_I_33_5]
MKTNYNLDRRSFVKILGLTSGGLILGCNVSSDKKEIKRIDDGTSFEPNLFVHLKKDGSLLLVASRSEMGQGIRTSLASAIADEMEADWKYVSLEQATGDEKYGNQNTDGSRSVRTMLEPMRTMGAMAKMMLISAAATKWGVETSVCKAENHFVVNSVNKKKIFFGDLVDDAMKLEVPSAEDVTLKEVKDFKYIGKKLKSVDLKDFTHGTANYGIDIRIPNMKFAAIARCPVTFGTVKSYKKEDTMAIAGVENVVEMERVERPFGMLGGVAVVAGNTWSAIQGKRALEIEWNKGDNASFNSESFQKKITDRVHKKAKVIPGGKGNINTAFKKAAETVEVTYHVPHLVHAPMEVPNATAWFHDGICEVWAPSQDPQTARAEAAEYLGIDKENVTINVTFLGGGFGRKSKPDYIVEAVALSKKINAPVQVVWTREDDIKHSYYHATSAQYFKGALNDKGNVTGWFQRIALPSIVSTFKPMSDYASGFELSAFTNDTYQVDNFRTESAKAEAHVRIGWLRSVVHIHSGFGINSFVDELAAKANKDPLQFQLDLMGNDRVSKGKSPHPFESKRLKNVLQTVAKKANWGRKLPEDHGLGLAVHYSFYSYVSSVVEVSVKNDKVKVENVWSAIDCGLVLNKDNVINQLEGAAIFGMSIALHGKITAKDGAVEQNNFFDYQMTRMKDAPNIDVTVIDNMETEPTGVGEPGVPPIAPAICNAIFNATGKRIRSLPLSDHGLV